MANTQSQIVERLVELNKALEVGTINELELEEMVQLSREFHEKMVIIQYKAIEKNVYAKTAVSEAPAPEKIEETVEDEVITAEDEGFDFSNPAVENPEIDFSIFDADKPEQTEKKENTLNTEVKKEVEATPYQEKIIEKQSSILEQIDEEKYASFHERFAKSEDDSFISKMSASKIESLKSAFGLNEKMQVINELFNGNSDFFNKAIEILDNQASSETARQRLSEIAVTNEWNLEQEIVEEFVRKVERRYA
ncbi:MAG: hypothetical protein ACPGU5_02850 [Lishizhenia sp.]